MTTRIKSALLLIVMLLIGMVLGALLNARLAEQRIERIASLRSPGGFVRYMERVIEPQNAAQREAVQAILERAADRMADHMMRSRSEARAIIDSTRAELEAVLTEEQMQQLEEGLELRRLNRPGWRGRRGPPPR